MDEQLALLSREFGFDLSTGLAKRGIRHSFSRAMKPLSQAIHKTTRRTPPTTGRPALGECRLPSELLDQIIDHLHGDTPTLRNCSLLCRALAPSARYHIFHKVVLNPQNFVRFLATLLPSPEIASFVRILRLEAGANIIEALQRVDLGEKPIPILRVFTLVIAPRLPAVTELSLRDVPFDTQVAGSLAPLFPLLHTLRVYDCWFLRHSDLESFIDSHPAIHTIRAGRISVLHASSPPPPRTGTKGFRLRELKVIETHSPSPLTMMPWLIQCCRAETLSYALYRLDQIANVTRSLVDIPALAHLHLVFFRWRKSDVRKLEEEGSGFVPFAPTVLRSLTLQAREDCTLIEAARVLSALEARLFPRLVTITLVVHLRSADLVEVPETVWADIDKALNSLPALASVVVQNNCKEAWHVDEGRDTIASLLPLSRLRNLLVFNIQKSLTSDLRDRYIL